MSILHKPISVVSHVSLLCVLVLTVSGCVRSHHGWHYHTHRHNHTETHAGSRAEKRTLADGPLVFQRVPLRRGGAR